MRQAPLRSACPMDRRRLSVRMRTRIGSSTDSSSGVLRAYPATLRFSHHRGQADLSSVSSPAADLNSRSKVYTKKDSRRFGARDDDRTKLAAEGWTVNRWEWPPGGLRSPAISNYLSSVPSGIGRCGCRLADQPAEVHENAHGSPPAPKARCATISPANSSAADSELVDGIRRAPKVKRCARNDKVCGRRGKSAGD